MILHLATALNVCSDNNLKHPASHLMIFIRLKIKGIYQDLSRDVQLKGRFFKNKPLIYILVPRRGDEAIFAVKMSRDSREYKALLQCASDLTVLLKNNTVSVSTKLLEKGLVTCLLYTSPSPRDATLSRMPSSA